MRTHDDVNSRFIRLDSNQVILGAAFRGWWAWPIVKERLWLYCLNDRVDESQSQRKKITEVLRRLSSGIWQISLNLLFSFTKVGAVFYEGRSVSLPDGRRLHPHLGSLERLERSGPWLHYRFPWAKVGRRFPCLGEIEDYGISSVVAVFASVLRFKSEERMVGRQIASELLKEFPELDAEVLYRITSDQLARFSLRFLFSRHLLARSQVKTVIVLDSDGKIPEIAAAKSLGLNVSEVQHGMFSTREPAYSWQEFHREVPLKLPLPDTQVVFGEVWAEQLREAGYWSQENIVVARNPLISEYHRLFLRQREARKTSEARPLQVLFPTQGYVREAAVKFWVSVLEASNHLQTNFFQLSIKVHPLERDYTRDYSELAEKYADRVSIISEDIESFDAMLSADVVVGYTSLMMVEAIGIGLPVIGLEGQSIGAGIAKTFRMPELANYIFPCAGEEEFFRIVRLMVSDYKDSLNGCSGVASPTEGGIYCLDGPSVEDLLID